MTARRKYYQARLSAERLRRAYEIAPPRVRRYLRAEVEFVLDNIRAGACVLDLGCGYGRIIPQLMTRAGRVVGIDNSLASLALAKRSLGPGVCQLAAMDAGRLGFRAGSFDAVVCIQNGISAFNVPARTLLKESLRVTRPNGTLLFSTYADCFWEDRLEWFRLQAQHGLIGEVDEERTRRGEIVCRDGFRATTFTAEDFRELARGLPARITLREVDSSSLFCLMRPV